MRCSITQSDDDDDDDDDVDDVDEEEVDEEGLGDGASREFDDILIERVAGSVLEVSESVVVVVVVRLDRLDALVLDVDVDVDVDVAGTTAGALRRNRSISISYGSYPMNQYLLRPSIISLTHSRDLSNWMIESEGERYLSLSEYLYVGALSKSACEYEATTELCENHSYVFTPFIHYATLPFHTPIVPVPLPPGKTRFHFH